MPSHISIDTGEVVWTGREARDVQRRQEDVLLTAQKVAGVAEMMTLNAAMLRGIGETDVADAIDALVHDEIRPRVAELHEKAEDIGRYGS